MWTLKLMIDERVYRGRETTAHLSGVYTSKSDAVSQAVAFLDKHSPIGKEWRELIDDHDPGYGPVDHRASLGRRGGKVFTYECCMGDLEMQLTLDQVDVNPKKLRVIDF
jgi:hypothetical protein